MNARWSVPRRGPAGYWSLFALDGDGDVLGDLTIWDDGRVSFTGDCRMIEPDQFRALLMAAGILPRTEAPHATS